MSCKIPMGNMWNPSYPVLFRGYELQRTTEALEKIQVEIGNFILQVPRSTSKVSTWTEAGLMPMKYRIWLRKARYY